MNHDDMTDELNRTLRVHTAGIDGSSISLGEVKGRATQIRRRRAAAGSMAAAAAVAILVPTAMAGSDLFSNASRDELPPATQHTQVPTPTPADGLDIADLPRGAEPGIAWVESGTLHHDGRDIPLPEGAGSVATLGDEYIVSTRNAVVVLDAEGRVITTEQAAEHTGLAVNAAGTAAAWMGPDNAPVVWQAGFPEALHLDGFTGPGGNPQAVGLTGEDCTADPETKVDAGCVVVFTVGNDRGDVRSYASDTHGIVDLASSTLHAITAVSAEGRMAGITEITDDGTCSAVLGEADSVAWSTCDHRLGAFSPDGSLLTGPQAYGSGIGDGEVAILSASDGEVLVSLDNRESQSFVARTAWEDDGHVLAEVFQAGQWAIVRIGLDGSMEYAVGPVPGNEMEDPFHLAVGP